MSTDISTVLVQKLGGGKKKTAKKENELTEELKAVRRENELIEEVKAVGRENELTEEVKAIRRDELTEVKAIRKPDDEDKSTPVIETPVSKDLPAKAKGQVKSVEEGLSASRRRRKDKTMRPTDVADNKKITDYYQVRRSTRCTAAELKKQRQSDVEECVRSGKHDGLEVRNFEGKGRGVVATRQFSRGDFLVEYAGELIELSVAKDREQQYAKEEKGCYIYYFTFKDKNYCIDATEESGLLGRLVNHSCKNFNCATKPIEVDGRPRLILVATRSINVGDELLYDYGDRSPESLKAHPWLAF